MGCRISRTQSEQESKVIIATPFARNASDLTIEGNCIRENTLTKKDAEDFFSRSSLENKRATKSIFSKEKRGFSREEIKFPNKSRVQKI